MKMVWTLTFLQNKALMVSQVTHVLHFLGQCCLIMLFEKEFWCLMERVLEMSKMMPKLGIIHHRLECCSHLSQFAISVRGLSLTLSLVSSVMARWRLVWGVGWLVGSWPGGTAASASGRPSHKRFGCLLECEQTWFPQGSSHNSLASHSHCWLSHAWNKTDKQKESVKISFPTIRNSPHNFVFNLLGT